MDQHSSEIVIKSIYHPLFEFFSTVFLFHKNIADTAITLTGWKGAVLNAGKYRIKFKSECLSAKWVEFCNKNIRLKRDEMREEKLLPLRFDIFQHPSPSTWHHVLKILIHLQAGELQNFHPAGVIMSFRAAKDQCDLVFDCNGLTDFQATMKMADSQDVLAVVSNPHVILCGQYSA